MFLLTGEHGACQETWAGCFSYQMQGLGSVGGWGEVDPATARTGRAQPGACSWPWLEAGPASLVSSPPSTGEKARAELSVLGRG